MFARLLALAAAIPLLLAACGGYDDDDDSGDTQALVFTEDDTGITVAAGDAFAIEIEGSPGVGDDWRLTEEPDESIARFVHEDDRDEEDEDGGTVTWIFEFEAVATGETSVEIFNCYRCLDAETPSAENAANSETLTFDITVE